MIDDGQVDNNQSEEENDEADEQNGPPEEPEDHFEESYEVPKIFWNYESITDWTRRIKAYDETQKKFYN